MRLTRAGRGALAVGCIGAVVAGLSVAVGLVEAVALVAGVLFVASTAWFGTTAVRVRVIAAKGRDLDLGAVLADEHHAKVGTDQLSGGEQRHDLIGRRVGGDIEILGGSTEQAIPHTAADEVGMPSALFQRQGDSPGQILRVHG